MSTLTGGNAAIRVDEPEGRLSRHFSNADIGNAAGYYWRNLDSVSTPFLAINPNPNGVMGPKMLGWAGRGSTSVSVSSGQVLRLSAQPWCTEPVCFKVGNPEDSVYTTSQLVGTTITPSKDSTGAIVANPERADPTCFSVPYMGTTLADSGFVETAGLRIGPMGQFCGGYLEVDISAGEGVVCSAVAIGQKESRELGLNSLTQKSMIDTSGFGLSGLYDFDHSAKAATMGKLSSLKGAEQLVGGAEVRHQFFAIPIIPSRLGMYEINHPDQNSIWAAIVSQMKESTNSNPNAADKCINTAAFNGSSYEQPFTLENNYGQTAWAANTLQPAMFIPRISRATNSMGQTLLDGMPQFEVHCRSGVVQVQIRFKMLFQMMVPTTHPLYDGALSPVRAFNEVSAMMFNIGGHSGTGGNTQLAIADTKVQMYDNDNPEIYQIVNRPHPIPTRAIEPRTGAVVLSNDHPTAVKQMFGNVGNIAKDVGSKLWDWSKDAVGWAWDHRDQAAQLIGAAAAMRSGQPGLAAGFLSSGVSQMPMIGAKRYRPEYDSGMGYHVQEPL